jgi:cytochrome d ubiquinol oxidase subunit II
MIPIDLPTIWAFVIAFAVFAYVVLDGFDLGIGILFPLLPVGHERDTAMNSIAPVWDGNETWLVLGGGGLMAAFPLAYGIVLSALYTPIIALVLALIFRGVAFEFRWRDPAHRKYWDTAFALGSFVAAFAQGVALGGLLQGTVVTGRTYGGGWWDWLSPFSLLVGASVVAGYALLGSTWLIWKSDGSLQARCRRLALRFGVATLVGMAAVSAATPFLAHEYWQRWFGWPQVLFTAQVPLLVIAASAGFFLALRHKRELWPFLIALALFALGQTGLGISMYPHIVPRSVTIWQAAAPDASLEFMLVGAAVLIPIILAYTAHAYWVFRGKTGSHGYH